MSGLPIISPLNSVPVSIRDNVASVVPTPPQGTAAVVKTMTANAVQQARALDTTDAAARKSLPLAHEKRGRLVGPPPTFEINVLQHLQETRMLPDEPAPGTEANAAPVTPDTISAAPDDNTGDDTTATANTAPNSAYQVQGQIDAPATTSQAPSMNISL